MKCENQDCENEIDVEFKGHFLDDCEVCEDCWEIGLKHREDPKYNEYLIESLKENFGDN